MSQLAASISRLINVTINLSPTAAQIQNINTLLILGGSSVIDVTERYRAYTSPTQIALDFGSTAPEYLAGVLWFEQNPQPTTLYIGRWSQTATSAIFRGGIVSVANQTALMAVASGGFKITIDGTLRTVTGIVLNAQTNMNGVASQIQTALAALVAGATCVWNSVYTRFEISSPTTGVGSTITFLTAPGAGTDISHLMSGLSGDSGYLAQGMAAETALAAATLFDANYGPIWYGLFIAGVQVADHTSHSQVANYLESTTTKHTYWVSLTDPAVPSSATTDDASILSALHLSKTIVQWSSLNPYAVVSLAAKALTINYNGNNTVIDLMYKQEPGIVPEGGPGTTGLSTTQLNFLESKNANVFLQYDNNTAIIEKGNNTSGDPVDIITGADWLALTMQNELFNLSYQSPTKIPQTDAGNNQYLTTIESVLGPAVTNGFLAPGTWTQTGFGAISKGDFLPKGFYVYAPPIASQLVADRNARKSVAFQIAAKLAGSIRTADIAIYINR